LTPIGDFKSTIGRNTSPLPDTLGRLVGARQSPGLGGAGQPTFGTLTASTYHSALDQRADLGGPQYKPAADLRGKGMAFNDVDKACSARASSRRLLQGMGAAVTAGGLGRCSEKYSGDLSNRLGGPLSRELLFFQYFFPILGLPILAFPQSVAGIWGPILPTTN